MSNDPQAIVVRAVQPEDYEQWLQLWLAYQDFYQVSLDETTTRTAFSRLLDTNEAMACAVAVQGDELVGLVHALLHRSTWAVADFCYLEDLYVAPTVRGGGTGKLLIEWVQRYAQHHGCARLYWHTQQTNKRAQKLYNWIAEDSGCIEYRMAL